MARIVLFIGRCRENAYFPEVTFQPPVQFVDKTFTCWLVSSVLKAGWISLTILWGEGGGGGGGGGCEGIEVGRG